MHTRWSQWHTDTYIRTRKFLLKLKVIKFCHVNSEEDEEVKSEMLINTFINNNDNNA